jgi:hypothetical protein
LDRRDNPRSKEQPMVDWSRLPEPPAVPPADLGIGETLDDERAWLMEGRHAARRRTALLVVLAVVAVIVARLAYRRFQR